MYTSQILICAKVAVTVHLHVPDSQSFEQTVLHGDVLRRMDDPGVHSRHSASIVSVLIRDGLPLHIGEVPVGEEVHARHGMDVCPGLQGIFECHATCLALHNSGRGEVGGGESRIAHKAIVIVCVIRIVSAFDVVEYSAADIIDMQCTPLVVQQIERGYLFFLVHGLYPSVSECVGLVTAYYIDAVEGDFGHNQLFSEDSLVSFHDRLPVRVKVDGRAAAAY